MRKSLLFPALLTGAILFGGASAGSVAQAAPAASSALNGLPPISEIANENVTKVGRRWRRRGYRHRYRRHRHHRGRNLFIGSLLGLGLLAAPHYRYRRHYGGGRCSYWARRCANNWGYGNNDFYGCLRYYGCR